MPTAPLTSKWPTFANVNTCKKKPSSEIILHTLATRKTTAFLRHAAYSLFHFPQNTVYFTIISFSVQIICSP
jgi:hypothetical protein